MSPPGWDLVGGNPAPGDPALFESVGRMFRDKATRAESAATGLSRLVASVDAGVWRGEAADAFRENMQEFPPRLQVCNDAYEIAAGVLTEYGKTLRELQERAKKALEDAVAADEELAQKRSQDPVALDPTASLLPDPYAPTTGHLRAIDPAQLKLQDARREIEDIREERVLAEGRVIYQLDEVYDPHRALGPGSEPAIPEPPRDAGAGKFDSEWTGPEDIALWAVFNKVVGKLKDMGWDVTAELLAHFLGRTGATVEFDANKVNRLLREDGSVKSTVEGWVCAEVFKRLPPGAKPGDKFTFQGSDWHLVGAQDPNWKFALAHFNFRLSEVTVEVLPPEPGRLRMQYQMELHDQYNWDKNANFEVHGIPISEDKLGQLHRAGLAREFEIHGVSGQNPPDGQPLEMSMDDVKNRAQDIQNPS